MAASAAICIGVNRAGSMPGLQAAATGAHGFAAWAERRVCGRQYFW